MQTMKSVPEIQVDPSVPVHFFQGPGPMDVEPHGKGWKFHYFLDKVEGATRKEALAAIRRVLKDPKGWARTGVRWVHTTDQAKANIIVNVVPQDSSPCGKGSAGCYSWGGDKPQADLGVEHINDASTFAELVNMEICGHGTFRMTDMYQGDPHSPATYVGVMGTWAGVAKASNEPSEQEIISAQQWLAGLVDPARIHND